MDQVEQMLPEALEHVSALDIFVESIAFGLDDLDRMGQLARKTACSSAPTSSSSRRCAPFPWR